MRRTIALFDEKDTGRVGDRDGAGRVRERHERWPLGRTGFGRHLGSRVVERFPLGPLGHEAPRGSREQGGPRVRPETGGYFAFASGSR